MLSCSPPPISPTTAMASSSSHAFLSLFLFMFLLHLSASPTTSQAASRNRLLRGPTDFDHNATDPFLSPHNDARRAVGVAPLSWSANLTRSASLIARRQRDLSACRFADLSASVYGANQVEASYPVPPAEVVALWVDQKKWYSYASNTCEAGHQCGTYTQVVWRKTTEVGCAQAVCSGGATISLCLYYPPATCRGRSLIKRSVRPSDHDPRDPEPPDAPVVRRRLF